MLKDFLIDIEWIDGCHKGNLSSHVVPYHDTSLGEPFKPGDIVQASFSKNSYRVIGVTEMPQKSVNDVFEACLENIHRDTYPKTLRGRELPYCHQEKERCADKLSEAFYVYVNRFGTGNAEHSGDGESGVSGIVLKGPKWDMVDDSQGVVSASDKIEVILNNLCDSGVSNDRLKDLLNNIIRDIDRGFIGD